MYCSFLSIDIAGSTIIKHGTTPANITTTFNNYHSFLKSVIKKNNGVVTAVSGDGIMAQVDSPDNAVSCACEIQAGMKEGKGDVLNINEIVRKNLCQENIGF